MEQGNNNSSILICGFKKILKTKIVLQIKYDSIEYIFLLNVDLAVHLVKIIFKY